ncbi:MAG: extracellular solute-binding protein [Fimbriimonas sp.]|nr:extracellular solute-binding protein [Fimbriimonas sp.]
MHDNRSTWLRTLSAGLLFGLVLLPVSALAQVTHLIFRCWDGDDNMPAIFAAARSFEKAYPNIKVKVESVTDEYQEKLLSEVAAGIAPDVAMMDPTNIEKLSVRHALLPLDDFIAKSHYDIGAYYPNLVQAHRFGGKLYVLPRDIAPISPIYYNKRLFDEAGIPYPDGKWTWDYKERPELREHDFLWVIHHLTKEKNGQVVLWGYAPSWQDLLWQQFALSTGGRWADDYMHPMKMTYDDPRVMRAIQFTADLTLKYHWIPSATAISTVMQSSAKQAFAEQKIAMFQSGIWEVPFLRKELLKGKPGYFDWDIAMPPAYKDGTLHFPTGGSGYAIMSGTTHPWEAWLLTKWMAGAPGLKELARTGLAQPAIRKMSQSPPWVPGPETPAEERTPANRIMMDTSAPLVVFGPYGSEWGEASDFATRVFTKIWDGSAKAQDVIPEANAEGQARLDYLRRSVHRPPFNWTIGGLVSLALFGVLAFWVYWPERKIKRTHRQKLENRVAYFFVMPWVLGLILFTAGPMLLSLLMSFADWDIIQPAKWRGVENFREAFFVDPRFWISLKVTLLYTIVSVPLGVASSLALALLLNVKVRAIPLWRTCYYLPSVASGVASSLIWRRIFQPDGGLLNAIIYGPDGHRNLLGIASMLKPFAESSGQVNWLNNEHLALPALIIMSLWGAGGGMIILLAGLQGVPNHYYEAATLDGANAWYRFRHITVPMISPTLFFCLLTGFIGTFQSFTQALLMTNGGPDDSTMFFALHLWQSGFLGLRMGYASALGWVLFAVVMVFTVVQLRLSKWVYYEGG